MYSPKEIGREETKDAIRVAARLWSQQDRKILGQFTTPRLLADRRWRTTAFCFSCSPCREGKGKVYEFLMSKDCASGLFSLFVKAAGECSGDPRPVRKKAPGAASAPITVQQRDQIIRCAQSLLDDGMKPTVRAVMIRRATDHPSEERVPVAAVRNVLRARLQPSLQQMFNESCADFLAFVSQHQDRQDGKMAFVQVRAAGNAFWWLATFPRFWQKLQELHGLGRAEKIFLSHDYTFNFTVQQFTYGCLALVVYRRLRGRWRLSTWPLVMSCHAVEHNRLSREALSLCKEEMAMRDLPEATQVNLDWFPGVPKEVREVFPQAACGQGVEHMMRNLRKNQFSQAKAKRSRRQRLSGALRAARLWRALTCLRSAGHLAAHRQAATTRS